MVAPVHFLSAGVRVNDRQPGASPHFSPSLVRVRNGPTTAPRKQHCIARELARAVPVCRLVSWIRQVSSGIEWRCLWRPALALVKHKEQAQGRYYVLFIKVAVDIPD